MVDYFTTVGISMDECNSKKTNDATDTQQLFQLQTIIKSHVPCNSKRKSFKDEWLQMEEFKVIIMNINYWRYL